MAERGKRLLFLFSSTCTQCGTSAELLQAGFTRLTPNTTYNCSVIAFNRFGPSAASFDVATTSVGTGECMLA